LVNVVKALQATYRIKGTTYRAHAKYLKDHRIVEAVMSRLSPEAAAALADPPLPGSWMDARLLEEIVEAVHAIEGDEGVLRLARQAIKDMLPAMVPIMQGVLRIFGASPSFLLPRMNDLIRPTVQGLEFKYTPVGERACTMDIHYATTRVLPRCSFVTTRAAFEQILSLCSTKGTITGPEVRGPQTARYQISW
jgi:hypothetical protein